MNTIIDLNAVANISYNNQSSYAISFGANAGNTTANVDGYATANITKQTSLNSITDAVRDLLIDVQFSNVGNVSMAYVGTYSNIGLLQIAPAAWRVNGIRSVPQYNEAFANVKYSDLTGGFAANPDYSYITTVNDQSGNTRTWTTSVNAIAQPTLSVTGNVIYNEDTLTNVTVANVLIDPGSVVTFRLYANTVPTYGSMSDGVTTGNSIFIDGNATSLNSQITAGGLKFLPASDFVSNVANAINFSLGNTTTVLSTANANIQIGTTHTEYNFPSGTYTEDTRLAFGNTITDLDTRALSFTVSIQQTAGNIGQFYVSNSVVGNANTQLNITNNRAAINNTIEWMPPVDYTGNVSFTYNQIKTLASGNVTQASNVVANFTAVTNPEISNMIARSYTSNVVNNIFSTSTPYINDGPNYGQTYTITLSSSLGKFGNSAPNAVAASSYSYSGNMTSVNNEFSSMVFVPNPGSASTGTFTYTQSRDGQSQVNTSPSLTGTNSNFTPVTYTFTGNGSFTPTFEEGYYGTAEILVVGGGGGGGGGNTYTGGGYSTIGGGGGGAGGVAYPTLAPNSYLFGTFNVEVGVGGLYRQGHTGTNTGSGYSNGADGTASGIGNGNVGYGANGGGGGKVSATNALNAGGSSGAGGGSGPGTPSRVGGSGANFGLGGGGGGANSVGGSAVATTRPGFGGSGFTSNISGTNVTYSVGGDGGGPPPTAPANGGTPGSGGGGSGLTSSSTGNGANGIVIIKIS